jgi:phosphonate transport system ATP-binding protein
MTLFALRQANLGYHDTVIVREVTLGIERGERVAIVGRSGAGKSTLLGALYQQQKARSALVPQDFALVKQLSVYHNVYIGRLHHHGSLKNLVNLVRPLRAHVDEVREILGALDMTEKLFTPVGELSGGQQQRTAVARALYHGGEILLGDEPVSAIDVSQARGVLQTMRGSSDTLVLVMHDVELALEVATRVIGLRDGRVVLDRPAAGVGAGELADLYR